MSQRTYWHLEPLRRVPSDYDIVTNALLYYPGRGFEVETPVADWYRRHQQGSWLTLGGCQGFRDPRETTYTRYTELQKAQETFVDGLLRSMNETPYDRELPDAWLSHLEAWLPVLRYPCHGLQMLAAYVGQMALASTIVVACCFQTGDEIRRIQRIAYRMRQLRDTRPGFGAESRRAWERAAVWQPLRALLERLLVTYDPSEVFIAVNLVLEPMFDHLFMSEFAHLAEQNRDPLLARIFSSLGDDCAWHRSWSSALVHAASDEAPELREALRQGLERWREPACVALGALEPLWTSKTRSWSQVQRELNADCERFWKSAGLAAGGPR
jgi:toluene monooxygenase system protein E